MNTYPLLNDSDLLYNSFASKLSSNKIKFRYIANIDYFENIEFKLDDFVKDILCGKHTELKDYPYTQLILKPYNESNIGKISKHNYHTIINNILSEIIYNYFINNFLVFYEQSHKLFNTISGKLDSYQSEDFTEKMDSTEKKIIELRKIAEKFYYFFNHIMNLYKIELQKKEQNNFIYLNYESFNNNLYSMNFLNENFAVFIFIFLFVNKRDLSKFKKDLLLIRNQRTKTSSLRKVEEFENYINIAEECKTNLIKLENFKTSQITINYTNFEDSLNKNSGILETNSFIKLIYEELKTLGLQTEYKDFEMFVNGKYNNLLFHRILSKRHLKNYELGFILYHFIIIFNMQKKDILEIKIKENNKINKLDYKKLYNNLKQKGNRLDKISVRYDFHEIYIRILNYSDKVNQKVNEG